eukprot:4883306-Ditylum_brightwellii.AAC.1
MDEVIGAEVISPRVGMGRERGSQETSWLNHGPCPVPFLQAMNVHARQGVCRRKPVVDGEQN